MSTLCYENDTSLMSNVFGFLRYPLEYYPYTVNADWVITGIPFDLTTTGRPGARFGPTAIRQSSVHLSWERCRWPWRFDIRKRLNVIDCGDLVFNTGNIKDMSERLQSHAELLLSSGKKLLSFGGDHYVTLPLLRAYVKFFQKLFVIHFDAHADTDGDINNIEFYRYDHGSVFFHALNEKLIDPCCLIQIGIRTEYDDTKGIIVLDAEYVNACSIVSIIEKIKKYFNNVNDMPVYLTFDIDCLDPSVAPGTGTPVMGGLNFNTVLKLLRGLRFCNIVGMDVVEVAPSYDCAQITALSAASIALEMLYIQASHT